jgi:hypothetical protein
VTRSLPPDIAAIIQLASGDATEACALLRQNASTPRLNEAIADALEKAKLAKPRGAPRKRTPGQEATLAQHAEWEIERLTIQRGYTRTRALGDVAALFGFKDAEQLDSLLKARRKSQRLPAESFDEPEGIRNSVGQQGK